MHTGSDAACKGEYIELAHKFPRLVMGANEMSPQRVRVGAQLEMQPALAAQLATALGAAPGTGKAGEGVLDVALSLPVLKRLLAQPGAVTLAPRSILPALGPGGSAHGVGVLDMALDPAALALAPLGVAYPRQAMPALLREMLAPCGDAGLVAGPDGLVACG